MRYLLLLLLISPISAKDYPVYRISSTVCAGRTCTTATATANLLAVRDQHAWFISLGHVLGTKPRIELGGIYYPVKLMKSWKVTSDSVILLKTVDKIPLPHIWNRYWLKEERKPQRGDDVWLVGFPGGKIRSQRTTITSVYGDHFLTRHHLREGASGGAVIFDDTKSLAGLVCGYDDRGRGVHIRSDLVYSGLQQDYPSLLPGKQKKEEPDKTEPPREEAPKPVRPLRLEDVLAQLTPILKQQEEDTRKQLNELKAALQASVKDEVTPELTTPEPPEPAVIPREEPQVPSPKPIQSIIGLIDRKPLLLPLLAGLGISIPGGAAGYFLVQLMSRGFSRRKRGNDRAIQSPFPRDTSEAEQIISLRQFEQREPVFDALRGIFLEDEFKSNPDQPFKEAYDSINRRFNETAPVATRHTMKEPLTK